MMKEPLFLKNVDILKHILKIKGKGKSQVLMHANSGVIKSIGEIALNIVKGTIPLSTCEKDKLRYLKSDIKKLGSKNLSIKEKRNILVNNVKLVTLILKPLLESISK